MPKYRVSLYMSTFSDYYVETEKEDETEAIELARAERQHDLERFGQGSDTVGDWCAHWEPWPECDQVDEEEV